MTNLRFLGSRRLVTVAAAYALFALSGVPALAQDGGAPAYAKACLRCHTVGTVIDWMKPYPDAAKRMAYLDRKLMRHYARNTTVRAEIIGYLLAEYAKATK